MFKANLKRYCLVLLLCMAVGMSANAQTTTQGSIAGTVFDSTGAVVPGATVTIHNNGTNANIVLTTEGSGYYKAPLLEPGTYTVTVKASNFTQYRANDVVVQVGQTSSIDPKLTAGAEGTVVEVTAGTPIINTESPDFAATLNQTAIASIPINNRRWSALAMTTPGVVADSQGFGLISVRGISTLQNNVEIDGADDNQAYYAEERGRTREGYSTSGAAVREFQVNSGVYSAEYGRAAGAVINSVTKSGTNQFHGQVYFYDKQSKWNAFNNYTKQTVLQGGAYVALHVKPKDLRKIYGFTVGGPIIKDKVFFTYTYDQHSRIFPEIGSPSAPATFYALPDTGTVGSDAFSGSTGSYLCNPNGYVTQNTATAAASTIDQQTCLLAKRLGTTYGTSASPLTTIAAGGYPAALASLNTDIGPTPRTGYQEINTPKIDWQINDKERVSFLYHRLRWDSPGGVQTANPVFYALDTSGTDFVKLDYGVAKLTSLITSSLSNEILFQYSRELNNEGQLPFSAYTTNNLVGTGSSAGNIPQITLASGGGGLTFGSPYYSYRLALPDERKWQIEDTFYWSKGNHSFKFGGDILHNWDKINNTFESNGAYTYNTLGNYFADLITKSAGTSPCDGAASTAGTTTGGTYTGTAACYASFVQGFGSPVFAINTLDWAIFAQDNWKFSPRLTLEIGLRYDMEVIPAPQSAYVNPAVPGTTNQPKDRNNFGPRIGFAYDVYGGGKTVLRGGFGMYYGRVTNGVLLNTQLNTAFGPAQYTTSYKGVTVGATPPGPKFPNVVTSTPGAPVTPSIVYMDKNLQNPMVNEFDLVLQQSLGHGTVFSLSYLGALGRELPNWLDFNLNPVTTPKAITISNPVGTQGPLGPNCTGCYTVPVYTSFINPSFGAIADVVSNINSSYSGLVAEIQNHSYKSVQFDFSYTWSHALDFNQNSNATTATEGWYDPYANPRSNYGNGAYNVPNRFVGYVLYNFPNKFRNGSVLGYIANGWSFNDSFQAQSGLPLSLTVSSSFTGALLPSWNGAGGTPAYIPNIGRNTLKYPRHIVDDARLEKSINFTDRYKLSAFAQVFNIANHQNVDGLNTAGYSLAGTTATYSSSFGTVSSSNASGFLYTPRQIEIGAKFLF